VDHTSLQEESYPFSGKSYPFSGFGENELKKQWVSVVENGVMTI
jgi:hypothetical protein